MYVIQLFLLWRIKRINSNPNLIYALTPFNKKKKSKERKKEKESAGSWQSLLFGGFCHIGFSSLKISPSTESNHAHLQRPHSADPDLELALDAFDIVQLDTLPPASSSGFPPEEEQLLRHADGVVAHFVASNVAAQPSEGQTADDGLVRLASSVTPLVVVVEATTQ